MLQKDKYTYKSILPICNIANYGSYTSRETEANQSRVLHGQELHLNTQLATSMYVLRWRRR